MKWVRQARRRVGQYLGRVEINRLERVQADYEQTIVDLEQDIARLLPLERLVSELPKYEYGSLTPGIDAWRARWEEKGRLRVLMFATTDFAGSLLRWAEALNSESDVAVRLVVMKPHRFDYPLDLLLHHPAVAPSGLRDILLEADVIHIKDEIGFFDGSNGLDLRLFRDPGKALVFTHYGGQARAHAFDPGYESFVAQFDARVANTPDLVFPWFDGRYVPHAIDTDRFALTWTDGARIAHSPSQPARKGTAEFEEAIRQLSGDFDLEYDRISGVSHEESLRRKQNANLFFDQAGRENVASLGTDTVIGWYGNAALEAGVHGIPTIAHLSDVAFEGAVRGGHDVREECGILNTPLGVDGIRDTIRAFLVMTPGERTRLSKDTREWVSGFHGYTSVARELVGVYDDVLDLRHT